jgi:hypothetical protein
MRMFWIANLYAHVFSEEHRSAMQSACEMPVRLNATRSWRRPELWNEHRPDQIEKPSAYWRDHSAGASRRRVTPMPLRKPALQRPDCFLLLVPSPTKWGLPVMFRGLAARR